MAKVQCQECKQFIEEEPDIFIETNVEQILIDENEEIPEGAITDPNDPTLKDYAEGAMIICKECQDRLAEE